MITEPGIYRDLPFDQYTAIDAINSGVVRWGIRATMLHMEAARLGRIKNDDTADRKFGRAVHCRLLEPEEYHTRFAVAQPCAVLLSTGNRAGQPCGNRGTWRSAKEPSVWACGSHKGQIPDAEQLLDYIDADEAGRIEDIAQALRIHDAMRLFRRPGWSEVSLVWQRCGVTCKARLDRFCDDDEVLILDLKKCGVGETRREKCEKAIEKYQYHVQAGMYVDGVQELTGKRARFVWVFIEDNYPYDVQVIPADSETIAIGMLEMRRTLNRYAAARDAGVFRGAIYDPKAIKAGGLTDYVRKQYADDDGLAEVSSGGAGAGERVDF